jgi:hypothetical protein
MTNWNDPLEREEANLAREEELRWQFTPALDDEPFTLDSVLGEFGWDALED